MATTPTIPIVTVVEGLPAGSGSAALLGFALQTKIAHYPGRPSAVILSGCYSQDDVRKETSHIPSLQINQVITRNLGFEPKFL